MERRGRLRNFKFRRADLLFVIGATAFLTEVVSNHSTRNGIIVASLALMGVPVFGRFASPDPPKDDDKDQE